MDVDLDAQPTIESGLVDTVEYGLEVTMVDCGGRSCAFRAIMFDTDRADLKEGIVSRQLTVLRGAFGSARDVARYEEMLAEDDSDDISIQLARGTYHIRAVCDEDCDDIDLVLRDDFGNVVDEDAEGDAVPSVGVTVREDADYEIEVEMYLCAQRRCSYGVIITADR